jgi:hypothetical protein
MQAVLTRLLKGKKEQVKTALFRALRRAEASLQMEAPRLCGGRQ